MAETKDIMVMSTCRLKRMNQKPDLPQHVGEDSKLYNFIQVENLTI